jgi:hypothetical protein
MKKLLGVLVSSALVLAPFAAFGSSPVRLVTTEISFFDGFGRDLESGKLSWWSVDGLSKSSSEITAEKLETGELVATLRVPAKEIYLDFSDFVTGDGFCVMGQSKLVPKQGDSEFILPAYEDPVEQKVTVKLPGGYPVANAIVDTRVLMPHAYLEDENFRGYVSGTLAPLTKGAAFSCPDWNTTDIGWVEGSKSWRSFDGMREDGIKLRGITDRNGISILKGWNPYDYSGVQATFDDGVINQRTGYISFDDDRSTVLRLDYLPVVVYSSGDIDAYLNDLVELPISVIDSPQIEPALSKNFFEHAKRAGLQGASKAANVFAGVQVEVTSPSKVGNKICSKKQILKAKTNSEGLAKLKICASVSGTYSIKGKGAVGVTSFFLRVKGSPATNPTTLIATPNAKRATVSWGAPKYAGGAPIVKYVVTATSPGQKTKKVDVRSGSSAFKSRKIYLTDLAAPKSWQISVVAVTKHGEGEKSTVFVKVPNK